MLSMTGYGRSRICEDGRELSVELKAVNHRFLDVSYRVPKTLAFLEETLRTRVGEGELKRGHVDVSLTYQNNRTDASMVVLDSALVQLCAQQTDEIASALQKTPPTLTELIHLCGAVSVAPADEDIAAVTALAQRAYDEAFEQLQAMRLREGTALAADLHDNMQSAKGIAEAIALRAPVVPETYRERLQARLSEWDVQTIDAQRMAQEVALLADRCAIDEELARLDSHFAQFAKCLQEPCEVGRRMDFLLQEMNRETNTIGSKAADAAIAGWVVDMKCLLEKLREQVQNIV